VSDGCYWWKTLGVLQTQENDFGLWESTKRLNGGEHVEVKQIGDGGKRGKDFRGV